MDVKNILQEKKTTSYKGHTFVAGGKAYAAVRVGKKKTTKGAKVSV